MPGLETKTVSESRCRIHSCLLGILEHVLRPCNVEDEENCYTIQER